MAHSTNRHLPEADDRFVEALLEEHGRLGSGDDLALLALVRARTEEQPKSKGRTSSSAFGLRQWLQVAAVVTVIGIALTAAFRHFTPGSPSTEGDQTIAGTAADSAADEIWQPAEYTIRIRNTGNSGSNAPGTVAASSSEFPPLSGSSDRAGTLFAANWQTPLAQPLSSFPLELEADHSAGGRASKTLSINELQSLLASGAALPAGAITASSLLQQMPITGPFPAERAIGLSASTCPWNHQHQLLHITVDSAQVLESAAAHPARGLSRPGSTGSDGWFPVLAPTEANPQPSPISPSAPAREFDRALVETALRQWFQATLSKHSPPESELSVEWNPARVAAYRVLARASNAENQLSVLYELKATDHSSSPPTRQPGDLKYQSPGTSDDLCTARAASQQSSIDHSQSSAWNEASDDLRLAAAATFFAGLAESGRPPAAAELDLANSLMQNLPARGPEILQLREIVRLWSERQHPGD